MGGIDAHVRQHLYALYAMWREGIGSPLAYPSVCARYPTPDLHARRCMARRAGLMLTHSCYDAPTLWRGMPQRHVRAAFSRVHDATDSCHACDMYGETSPSEDSWVMGDAAACCMVLA